MKIFVLCPYGLVSGGPDALHQLVFYINQKHPNTAEIVYVDIRSRKRPVPNAYKVYVDQYLLFNDVPDAEDSVVVMPESLYFLVSKFTKAKKYIWWLGIDLARQTPEDKIHAITSKLFSKNFYKKMFSGYFTPAKTYMYLKDKTYRFEDEDKHVNHLCASYHAFQYVSQHSAKRPELLIEPIGIYFLNQGVCLDKSHRKNVVLYNPSKNGSFSKKIIRNSPGVSFLALSGYSSKELVALFRESKLYIDFGAFSGAERIPKEAVYNGCAILTGTNGASSLFKDVAISEEYKIPSTKDNLNAITLKIHYMLDNYEKIFHDFDQYREVVSALKPTFINRIEEIFF